LTGQFTNDVVKLYSMKSRYKIVLSEKNLENIFRRAENRDWVLFFDEADYNATLMTKYLIGGHYENN